MRRLGGAALAAVLALLLACGDVVREVGERAVEGAPDIGAHERR